VRQWLAVVDAIEVEATRIDMGLHFMQFARSCPRDGGPQPAERHPCE
jgi:hypothetical protein